MNRVLRGAFVPPTLALRMEFKDYYDTLGIGSSATAEEIKGAYRKLARKYHPDVSKETDAEDRFKEVGEAYEVLRDPEKRQAYDELGRNWQAGQDFRPPPDWESGFGFGEAGPAGPSGFSDFFDSLFGARGPAGGGGRSFRMRGEDVRAKLEVDLDSAYNGDTRRLTLQMPAADGSVQPRALDVRIPKGITQGKQIRLSGQGGPGVGGGPAGDLYLEISFRPHPLYRLEGRNIHLDLPITPWEAALGATVEVPTLGGRVDLTVPPNSGEGRILRLRGRGLSGTRTGDQYVHLKVVTPPADSDEAKEFYERMERELPFNPRSNI